MRRLVLCAIVTLTAAPLLAQQPADSARRCPHGGADDAATMVSAVMTAAPKDVGIAVDSALHDLGYRVSAGETRLEQWVTVPRFTWPAGAAQAKWSGDGNPGVQLIVDVAPDSSGLRLSVAASAVCLVGSLEESRRPGSPESAIETMSAMEAVTAVLERLAAAKAARP